MAKNVFINLPVKNVEATKHFFEQLGFSFNPQFSDEKAGCMIIAENSYAMLLDESYFQTFTNKKVSDAKQSTEVLIALDADSKEAVEALVKKAVSLGGELYKEPQDYGWMYQHSFADLDGHQWEIVYMDQGKMPNG